MTETAFKLVNILLDDFLRNGGVAFSHVHEPRRILAAFRDQHFSPPYVTAPPDGWISDVRLVTPLFLPIAYSHREYLNSGYSIHGKVRVYLRDLIERSDKTGVGMCVLMIDTLRETCIACRGEKENS